MFKCRGILIIITLLLFMIPLESGARVNFSDEVYEIEDVIVIGGDNYFPPFEYVDENNVYRGFNVDLMNAIALEMGLNIELKPMPWYRVLQALESGEIDAVQGMKYSVAREQTYLFSDAYLISSQSIFVHAENRHIINPEDLSGQRVAVQKNDISIDLLRDIDGVKIIETENQEIALRQLYEKEVDAYIGNQLVGLYIVQKNDYNEHIKIVGVEINPEKYAFATHKGSDRIIHLLNEGLEQVKAKGTYDIIYGKWFGQPINPPQGYARRILEMSLIIFLISMVVMYVFYKWNALLKKEVAIRTDDLKREVNFKEQTLNSIFSGLLTIDKMGTILYVNEKGATYMKTSREEMVGKKLSDTSAAEYIDETSYREVIQLIKSKIGIEREVIQGDDTRIFEYNICPLLVSDKEIFGATITFKDVTEVKVLQEKILVKDKLESLGRLTAGIAHEIRNPLTSIKAYVELIPEKYHKEDFRKKISVDVPKEIRRLNDIISGLLNYAKPKKPLKELCSVQEIMDDITEFLSGEINQNNVRIEKQLNQNTYIIVDKQQFRQIIINLLLNAVQATRNVLKPVVDISAIQKEDQVIIEISDNGQGIPEKDMDKIFDPFFTTKELGSGLGLSICYQFVKENRGDILVKSCEDKGTVFTMIFPAANQNRQTG